MTQVLDKKAIIEINADMLKKGMPVVYDNKGYNKFDYTAMDRFHSMFSKSPDSMSDSQAVKALKILNHYSKTQLIDKANSIERSIEYYETKPSQVKVDNSKTVKFVGTYKGFLTCYYGFNWGAYSSKIKAALQVFSKSEAYWKKITDWVYYVREDQLEKFKKIFQDNGYNTNAIDKVVTSSKSNPSTPSISLEVNRPEDSVDTLEIKFPFSKKIVEAIKYIPGASWYATRKAWEIPICKANDLYNNLPSFVDKTQLKTWADLTNAWKQSYELIDISKLNSKYTPYDFQVKDAQKLLKLQTGLNASEVGCGKTLEQVLIGESIPMKKLVICPATLRLNWEREIKQVNPNAKVTIQYSDKPLDIIDGWNIISYNTTQKYLSELEKELFQVVMVDEAHYCQAISNAGTPDSQRAFAVLRLTATSQYVFPITGTPKTSRNKNIYNILRMLRYPKTFGKYAFRFYGKEFCAGGKQTAYGIDYNGDSNNEKLYSILSKYMTRHLKRDVLPNITKQRQAIPVKVSLFEYHSLIAEYLKLRSYSSQRGAALAALNKAKQVIALQKSKHTLAKAKEILESGQKAVIVTCYSGIVSAVERTFKGNCLTLIGGMSDKQKQQAIDDFQNGDKQVMVININAGGVGVTLTAASMMIINDMPWTTGEIEQAEGRIWRSGQKNTAMIYFMVANECPMDEKLVNTIVSKSASINEAIDNGLGNSINLAKLVEESL